MQIDDYLPQQAISAAKEMNRLGKARRPFVFVIDFAMQAPLVLPLEQLDTPCLRFNIDGFGNEIEKKPLFLPGFYFEKSPIPFDTYLSAFKRAKTEIIRGNSYLLNLTQPTPVTTNLTLKDIFHHSKAKFKLWFDDRFVVFSPERFVKIEAGKIHTFPMKGTIDATLENAENTILNDVKETAEHCTIVDLLRNDLNLVAKQVRVKRFRYIDKINTLDGSLLQVSSEITGNLPDNWHEHTGEIIFRLLPAGSVSGAPKRKTVEIINATEGYERGFYTGIFGYFDGQRLDSAVMIRFIEKQGNQLVFKSGGGITSLSDPCNEYQELIDKIYVPIVGNHPAEKWQTTATELASAKVGS